MVTTQIPEHVIWQVPHRNFVRFLITQNYDWNEVNRELARFNLPDIPEKIYNAICGELSDPPGGDFLITSITKPLKKWAEENEILEMYLKPPELGEAVTFLYDPAFYNYVVGRGFKHGYDPDYLDLIHKDLTAPERKISISKETLRLFIRYFCNFTIMNKTFWKYHNTFIKDQTQREKIRAHIGMGANDEYITDFYEGILRAPPIDEQLAYMRADLSVNFRLLSLEGVTLSALTRKEKVTKMYNTVVDMTKDITISQQETLKNLSSWKETRIKPDMTGIDDVQTKGYVPARILHMLDSIDEEPGITEELTDEPTDEEE
jgi:hypothetical protein